MTSIQMTKLMEKTDKDILYMIKEYESQFIQLVHDRLGIKIRSQQINELHQVVIEACKKFDCSPQDYLQMLNNCSNESPLLEHLIAGVTIGETYFFRDAKQMELLQHFLLPTIIQEKQKQNNLSLRIWSAGCASGEELYTIAMLLTELIHDLNGWTLNLLGTDINASALQKAVEGRYSEWSMRSISDYFKQRYFTNENNQYLLTSKIRDLVKFDYLNLNDDCYPSIFTGTNAQDLILCRNVLIYFENDRIVKLMEKLAESLVPGGFLLLGASDPIELKIPNLIFHHSKGTLYSRAVAEPSKTPSVSVLPTIKKKSPIVVFKQIKPEKKLLHKVSITLKKSIDETEVIQLLEKMQWQQVLDMINADQNSKQSIFILNAKATALANLGRLTDAVKIFQEILLLDPTNKISYFTYALTLIELNIFDKAETALRKTLFLDHQFVSAHYQLGLLLLRNKQQEAGIRCLRNALTIAKTKDPNQSIPGPQALSYGRLAEILAYEIDIYSVGGHYAYQDSRE